MNKMYIHLIILFIISLLLSVPANASGLSNALKDSDPDSIQGPIMEVGTDYIIVMEKKIAFVDITRSGKSIKTVISDGKGKIMGKGDLKKRTFIFAKGFRGLDDKTQSDVLYATEISIVPHKLSPKDAKEYKGIMDKPTQP